MALSQIRPNTQMPTVPHWPVAQDELAQASLDYPLPVQIAAGTGASGGLLTSYLSCLATTNATLVKAAPGQIYKVKAFNNGATPVWLKLYNKATAPTVGSDTVFDKYEIVSGTGGAGLLDDIIVGQQFSIGIGFAVTAAFADNDTSAIQAGVVSVTVLYL